jgi:hypothetical protein
MPGHIQAVATAMIATSAIAEASQQPTEVIGGGLTL